MNLAPNTVEMIKALPLDRGGPLPLHVQVSRALQALLEDGRLKPGDRMPNVAHLAVLCGVSKGTAMQAVDELRRRQLLVVKRRSGIHVAEAPARAVEIFFPSSEFRRNTLADFLQQVQAGLKAGYDEPARRFMVTLANGHELSAQGLLAAAQARGVDGMVFYRPDPALAAAAAGVSREIPCVSLVRPIVDSQAACVAFDLKPSVQRWVCRHLTAGESVFAYVGILPLLSPGPDGIHAPYAAIYQAALETLARAGRNLHLCLDPEQAHAEAIPAVEDRLLRRAATLPDRAVVLAQTGTLGAKLAGLGKQFRILTYTEYQGTREMCRGKTTLLYAGLEMLGRAAAVLLKQAAGDPAALASQSALLEPEWVEPQQTR